MLMSHPVDVFAPCIYPEQVKRVTPRRSLSAKTTWHIAEATRSAQFQLSLQASAAAKGLGCMLASVELAASYNRLQDSSWCTCDVHVHVHGLVGHGHSFGEA